MKIKKFEIKQNIIRCHFDEELHQDIKLDFDWNCYNSNLSYGIVIEKDVVNKYGITERIKLIIPIGIDFEYILKTIEKFKDDVIEVVDLDDNVIEQITKDASSLGLDLNEFVHYMINKYIIDKKEQSQKKL